MKVFFFFSRFLANSHARIRSGSRDKVYLEQLEKSFFVHLHETHVRPLKFSSRENLDLKINGGNGPNTNSHISRYILYVYRKNPFSFRCSDIIAF